MTKHSQKDIIQEQMRANKRIFKAAASMSGQYVSRTPLDERMRRFVERNSSTKSSPQPPKSK